MTDQSPRQHSDNSPGGRVPMKTAAFPPEIQRAQQFVRWVEKKSPPTYSPFRKVRFSENVEIRWVCWFVLRDLWHLSLRQISQVFGYDHSTIIHGLRNITYEQVQRAVQLEAEFRSWRREQERRR